MEKFARFDCSASPRVTQFLTSAVVEAFRVDDAIDEGFDLSV